jgi:hypothetical protein
MRCLRQECVNYASAAHSFKRWTIRTRNKAAKDVIRADQTHGAENKERESNTVSQEIIMVD